MRGKTFQGEYMENKKITLINNILKIRISLEVAKELKTDLSTIEEFFYDVESELENRELEFNLENIKECSYEYLSEFCYGVQPIYSYEIMGKFKELQQYEIESIAYNSEISYNPGEDFSNFASCILAEKMRDILNDDLYYIFENCEIVEYEAESRKQVKRDIINYLENNRDIYIGRLAERYQQGDSLTTVDCINEYICKNLYCHDEITFEGWDIYKYYYIDFYRDKDIQKAILNY